MPGCLLELHRASSGRDALMSDRKDHEGLGRMTARLAAAGVPPAARNFYVIVWERWGWRGLDCFERQERLALQLSIPVRTLRDWERRIAAGGGWRRVREKRRRRLVFLPLPACTGSPAPVSGGATVPDHPGAPAPVKPATHRRCTVENNEKTISTGGGRSEGGTARPGITDPADALDDDGLAPSQLREFRQGCLDLGVHEGTNLSKVIRVAGAFLDRARQTANGLALWERWKRDLFSRVRGCRNPAGALCSAMLTTGEGESIWWALAGSPGPPATQPDDSAPSSELERLWSVLLGPGASLNRTGDEAARRTARAALHDLKMTVDDLRRWKAGQLALPSQQRAHGV